MAIRSSALGGVAVGVLLACSAGAAEAQVSGGQPPSASSALEQKVESLTAALQALDARLTEEIRARQALEAESAAARADAQAARAQLAAQTPRAPPPAAPAAVERAPSGEPSSFQYKGVTFTPGGFLAAEVIYRSRNNASDISSNFNRIPFDNSPLAHERELRGTARQSRFSLLVQADLATTIKGAAYGEFDLQGAAQTANSVESNSYNPRLRHLYGTVDWEDHGLQLLVGQNWSLATLNSKGITPRNEVTPPMIDGQYVPGFVWARQPQVRLVKAWDKTIWAAVSLENPQTTFAGVATGISSTAPGIQVLTTTPGVTGFDTANSLSLNHAPDVLGKVAYEPQIGGGRPLHLEVFGIWRTYGTRINALPGNALGLAPGVFDSNASGGGFGGSVTASVLHSKLDLQASVLSGRGVGRYGTSQLPDVTLRPDGTVAPIRETMVLLGATWHAMPTLDLYLLAGEERQDDRFFDDATGHYGYGNPAATFTAAGCTTEGGVCLPNLRKVQQITGGLWYKFEPKSYGQIRIGLQYSHTELTGFPGVAGFVPKTDDDMVFTSLRYYLP